MYLKIALSNVQSIEPNHIMIAYENSNIIET